MRSVLWLIPIVVLFAAVSCEHEPEFIPSTEPEQTVAAAPNSFDASTTGKIIGSVKWEGPIPNPQSFLFGVPAAGGNFTATMIPNPNAPTINKQNLAGAVVFLRGIEPSRAKPWDHLLVRIEMKGRGINVIQGDVTSRVGFIRRGDSVEMKSVEPVFHVLRARGASFYSLTFPQPDQSLERKFDTAGRVELSSGAGFYWANANLFVVDHPYYTRTDSEGHFEFENVPPGTYEVVAWLPTWDVTKQERDPETGLIFRQTYAAPLEVSRSVKLDAKALAVASLTLPK